jgi:hypothetical protein
MNKLGFTFYPSDWWSSDTFYELEDPTDRYIFLECLFIMYRNGGYMKTQKTQFENRTRIKVSDETWEKITAKFIKDENGFTSLTVNKRLKKAIISQSNGKLGGRPPKQNNPENPTEKPKEKEKEKEKEKVRGFILGNDIFIDGLKCNNTGKDFEAAFNDCFNYHFESERPPQEEYQWKQKFVSWLTRVKPSNGFAQKNPGKIQ